MEVSRRSLLIAGLSAGTGFAAGAATPIVVSAGSGPNDADLGFCTDMTAHHVQALAMCQRVLGRPTGDAVQAAAAEVLQNQAIEVGMMRAWLTDWGASTATPIEVMAWMHGGVARPLAEMHGYASAAELSELSTSSGTRQGRRWLELMRAHHVGGVEMALAATDVANEEKVVRLTRTQAASQSFEIEQYDALLATEYASL